MKVVWKVKHLFLVSAGGFLVLFGMKAVFMQIGFSDFIYLILYGILVSMTFRHLYEFRNMELREYDKVSSER